MDERDDGSITESEHVDTAEHTELIVPTHTEKISSQSNSGPSSPYDHPCLRDSFRLTMWIPKEQVGKVIGKKGAVILHIQRETKARVMTNPPSIADSLWSPILIIGDPSKTFSAFKTIKSLVDDVDDVVAEFPIPRQLHQRIVGSGGITIKTISARTNTRIWVPGFKEVSPGSNISLEGECENVFKALELVLDVSFRVGPGCITTKKAGSPHFIVQTTGSLLRKHVSLPSSLVGLLLARRGIGEQSSPNVLRQLEHLTNVRIWKLKAVEEGGPATDAEGPTDDIIGEDGSPALELKDDENVNEQEAEEEDAVGETKVEDDLDNEEDSAGFQDAREEDDDDIVDDVADLVTDLHDEQEKNDSVPEKDVELVTFAVMGKDPYNVDLAVASLRKMVEGERIARVLQRLHGFGVSADTSQESNTRHYGNSISVAGGRGRVGSGYQKPYSLVKHHIGRVRKFIPMKGGVKRSTRNDENENAD